MDLGDRWPPSIVRTLLLAIILVCPPLAHCLQTVAAPHNEKNGSIFRRGGNLTDPGLNQTNAQMPLPLASSTSMFTSTVESSGLSSSLSSSSGLASALSNSSQHPTPTASMSSSTSMLISSRFSSPSLSPPLSAVDILSSASRVSSSSAQSSTSSVSMSTTHSTTTPPNSEAMSPLPTQPIVTSTATTLIVSDVEPVTTPYSSQSPDPTSKAILPSSNSAAISTTSFWHKKGAVVAVFLFISLIGVAVIALAVLYYVKKRCNNRKHARLHEELFEKYSDPGHRSNSPGLSINGTPMDAFATSGIQHNNHFPCDDHQTPLTTPTASQSSFPVQHPDYYNPQPVRYLAPSQLQPSAKGLASLAFQSPTHTHSDYRASYQPSVDSFYGAASQPLGYNG